MNSTLAQVDHEVGVVERDGLSHASPTTRPRWRRRARPEATRRCESAIARPGRRQIDLDERRITDKDSIGAMALSWHQSLRVTRYQGPEHRSRASRSWPDTSGLLSCHPHATPRAEASEGRVPGTLHVRPLARDEARLHMTTPGTLAVASCKPRATKPPARTLVTFSQRRTGVQPWQSRTYSLSSGWTRSPTRSRQRSWRWLMTDSSVGQPGGTDRSVGQAGDAAAHPVPGDEGRERAENDASPPRTAPPTSESPRREPLRE